MALVAMSIELRFMPRFKLLLLCARLEECVCPFPLHSSVAVQQDFFISWREAGLAKEDGRPVWGNEGYQLQ